MAIIDNKHIKDRILRLDKYVIVLQNRLMAAVPAKYKEREEVYFDWLNLEIHRTQMTIDSLK